jgi:hypothetical protein
MKGLPWIVTVRESSWVYPTIETLHGIGMGLLVGTLTVIDLRVLGSLRRIPFDTLNGLTSLVWIGLSLNAVSGVLMFMSDGPRLVVNWIFQAKILLIAAGLGIASLLQRRIAGQGAAWEEGEGVTRAARRLAMASLLVWYAAIVAGRVTAFLGDQ